MEEEIWRPISLCPNYEVSDGGHVRNKRTGKILRPFIDLLQDYPRVNLFLSDGTHCRKMVHTLVMEAFRGPKPKGYEIDHINCDRADNRLENLRYVTPAENRANPRTILNNKVGNIKRLVKMWSISKEEGERRIKDAIDEYNARYAAP